MSLTSPRLIVPFIVLSLAALTIASCADGNTPTAPSSVTASSSETVSTAVPSAVMEYFVTLFDETPAPAHATAEPEDPVPAPAPAPPPASGSAPSPWPPGPPPLAAPGVPVPTPPSTHFRVSFKISPEPVLHSGAQVGLIACQNLQYTWYYDQYIVAETGVPITFTERQNFFDARYVSTNPQTIKLGGNATVILHTRWCSGHAKPHYTQTRFKGRDDYGEPVEISGPWVRLLTP